jgi:hypothetical protein
MSNIIIVIESKEELDEDYTDTLLKHKHKKGIIVTARVHPGEP